MVRERVLEVWRDFKKSLLDDKNLLEKLGVNLNRMSFGDGGSDIKESPQEVMEYLKRNLPFITQNCQELRNKYISNQFGEKQLISDLWLIYLSYIGLVETYQKIVEYYDNSQKGPTIEEIN